MAAASSSASMGKLYLASMNMRGKWAEKPHDNVLIVNVTSAQSKTSKNRLTFSPMTPVEGGYKGEYLCFENWWQHFKWYEGDTDESFDKRNEWWKSQTSPKRRYLGVKEKKFCTLGTEITSMITFRPAENCMHRIISNW